MPDSAYKTYSLILESRGITARYVDDSTPNAVFLNEANAEELAENSVGSRLGSTLITKSGTTVLPLTGGAVHSISKLSGLNGTSYRYAGCGSNLYRRSSLTPGAYTLISSTMSGNPWQEVGAAPSSWTSIPYAFFADGAKMLKDNGTLSAPQQMGIFQPQYPCRAQAQQPTLITLDNYLTTESAYTYTGIGGGTNGTFVSTTLQNNVTPIGIRLADVPFGAEPQLFQLLTVDTGGNQEVVLVLQVVKGGFYAKFTKTHLSGVPITSADLEITVPASTTATVGISFAALPVGPEPVTTWPTTLELADYIGLFLKVSDPTQIQSIQLKFDCGDGSFDSDFFYKVIAQGPLQSLLDTAGNNSTDATTAATDALLDQSLGLFGNSTGSIVQLVTGLDNWNPLLIQLSEFAGAGRANFNDPVYNWSAINGYQITVVMNDQSSATINFSSLILFGGAGPDSLGGVSYDYLFTFFNNVDGTESNPCMVMSNVNPPTDTYWVTPRRQPVALTMTFPTLDTQTTSLRVYRRGGTLGDNYRRLETVAITSSPQTYIDKQSDDDISGGDFVSFTNDVPVTSTLQTPVNTSIQTSVTTVNQVTGVPVFSTTGMSVGQQVTLGTPGVDAGAEVVIVLSISSGVSFQAFVQNEHLVGQAVTATAQYGKPVTIMAEAFDQFWFAGDSNNPNFLYYSQKSLPQAVSSAAYIQVSTSDDPITAIVKFKGSLYVSTVKAWWAIAPGSNINASPTVYPTACKKGCIAPLGFIVTEEAIYYQAVDGIRAFAGGASEYLSQDQEFVFQGVGTSPIVEADQSQLSKTRAAYWNTKLFFSYIGMDGNRHRLIYDTSYKRFRNDDIDAQSIYLEDDTNTLVFGSLGGLVHIDRVGSFDEGNNAGTVANLPIAMTLQTPYLNQGMPAETKQYQEFTLDCNTNGQPVTVTLLFEDGQSSAVIGTITTSLRQRVNLTLNGGDGYTAYKVSLKLTANATQPIYIYQAAIRALQLAKTRKSLDTYDCKFGIDSSKLLKQTMLEYTSTATISGTITYDDPAWPAFTFTLPNTNGKRNPLRLRLPATKFRWMRCILTSTADFQVWSESVFEVKPICEGKSYQQQPLLNVET